MRLTNADVLGSIEGTHKRKEKEMAKDPFEWWEVSVIVLLGLAVTLIPVVVP